MKTIDPLNAREYYCPEHKTVHRENASVTAYDQHVSMLEYRNDENREAADQINGLIVRLKSGTATPEDLHTAAGLLVVVRDATLV